MNAAENTSAEEIAQMDAAGMKKMQQALRLASVELPHLSGLANAVRIFVDRRIDTAAISAAGRLLVNPEWFLTLKLRDAAFVAAHELLHLCLQSHERSEGTDLRTFNCAHDYIINDILSTEMALPGPQGCLQHPGARNLSAEQIVMMLRSNAIAGPRSKARGIMSAALQDAGIVDLSANATPCSGDVIDANQERELFPDALVEDEGIRQKIRILAAEALSLRELKQRLEGLPDLDFGVNGVGYESNISMIEALRSFYRPPWEWMLQQWLEAIAPGPRTYVRPSRRGVDREDVVLPGRRREGWTLHIILDTSGSMSDTLPRILGWIRSFCESAGVNDIHLLQCDETVTVDEFVSPEQLGSYRVAGYGGSDMSPALRRLEEDSQVEAAIVLTDGMIDYPAKPLPYQILWVLTGDVSYHFAPSYGHVLRVPESS